MFKGAQTLPVNVNVTVAVVLVAVAITALMPPFNTLKLDMLPDASYST